MNMVDARITKILSDPEYSPLFGGWYSVVVQVESWGRESETTIGKRTREEIDNVKVGDTIQI